MMLRPPTKADQPMTFTGAEFRRGAFAAWLAFMIQLICLLVVTAVLNSGLPWGPPQAMIALYLMYGVPIGGAVSAAVVLITAPVLLLISRRLVRVRRVSVHIVVYTAFGAFLGLFITAVSVLLTRGDFGYVYSTWFPAMVAAVCAASVVAGWGWTVWRHRRPRS